MPGHLSGLRRLAPPPLHIAVPVWGEGYTRTFLDFCLPAQLARDNVPVLLGTSGCSYTIFTTAADATCICASDAYHALADVVPVRVELIDDELRAAAESGLNKYLISDKLQQAHVLSLPEWILGSPTQEVSHGNEPSAISSWTFDGRIHGPLRQ